MLETRRAETGTVQRRRACQECGQRFATVERISTEFLRVRKQDGSLENFSREKIAKGIGKASSVFRISTADIDAFVERIVDRLQPPGPGIPIPSHEIGHLVLQILQDSTSVTDVARIRFAMTFLGKVSRKGGFRDAQDLRHWLENNYPLPITHAHVDHTNPDVLKRTPGHVETFDHRKLERSIGLAAKGRGTDSFVRTFASRVARLVRERIVDQPVITSQQIATEVLSSLRQHDEIAYLRYAATVKPLRSVEDFWREVLSLTTGPETRSTEIPG
ncbi:ATP cone domain-containing protein [Actinosynnema sp. NPDC023794]